MSTHSDKTRTTASIVRRFAGPIVAISIGAAVLTGCSAGGQSKADACSTIQEGLTEVTSNLQTEASKLASDPEAASDGIDALADAFEETAGDVDEAEIKKLAEDASEKVNTFSDAVDDAVNDPENLDQDAFTTATTDVQDSIAALSEACSG